MSTAVHCMYMCEGSCPFSEVHCRVCELLLYKLKSTSFTWRDLLAEVLLEGNLASKLSFNCYIMHVSQIHDYGINTCACFDGVSPTCLASQMLLQRPA